MLQRNAAFETVLCTSVRSGVCYHTKRLLLGRIIFGSGFSSADAFAFMFAFVFAVASFTSSKFQELMHFGLKYYGRFVDYSTPATPCDAPA